MWSTLLAARLTALGWGPTDLARRLSENNLSTTRQAVQGWLAGGRPEPWKWASILFVLGVTERDKGEWEDALKAPPGARP